MGLYKFLSFLPSCDKKFVLSGKTITIVSAHLTHMIYVEQRLIHIESIKNLTPTKTHHQNAWDKVLDEIVYRVSLRKKKDKKALDIELKEFNQWAST